MKTWAIIVCALGQILVAQPLIIPDEVPSLLSIIYSNIPTIKKGTDSRLGWGFRLGDRADFQVLVELGPQLNTQPLANQEDKDTRKRNSADTLSNILWAQRQQDKIKKQQAQAGATPNVISKSEGGSWIQNWAQSINQDRNNNDNLNVELDGARPGLGVGEIDAKSVIPDDATLQLEQLYRNKSKSGGKKSISTTPSTTTSKEEPLDNVNLS